MISNELFEIDTKTLMYVSYRKGRLAQIGR